MKPNWRATDRIAGGAKTRVHRTVAMSQPMQHAIHRVRAFEIVSPYTLCVRFDDTTEQTIDFEPILEGELYGPLRDLTLNSLSKSELIPTPRL